MRMAMIGLGRMGANMARRLCRGGIEVVGYNRSPEVVEELARAEGLIPALSLAISATVAGLAMFAIQRMVLKPVRRLTSSSSGLDVSMTEGNGGNGVLQCKGGPRQGLTGSRSRSASS